MLRAETFLYLGVGHTREAGKPASVSFNVEDRTRTPSWWCGLRDDVPSFVGGHTPSPGSLWVPDATPRGSDTAARNGDYQRYLGGRVAGHLNASAAVHLSPQDNKASSSIIVTNRQFDVCFLHVKIWLSWAQLHGISVFFASNRVNVCLLPPRPPTRKTSSTSWNPLHLHHEFGQHDAIFRYTKNDPKHAKTYVPLRSTMFHHVSIRTPIHITPFPKKTHTTESQHSFTSKGLSNPTNKVDTKWLKQFCNLSMVSMAFSCSLCFTAGSGKARHVAVAAGCDQGGSAGGSWGTPCSSRWRCGLKSSLTSHMAPALPWEIRWTSPKNLTLQGCGRYLYLQLMASLRQVMIQYDSPVDLELPYGAIEMEKGEGFSVVTLKFCLKRPTCVLWCDDVGCMQYMVGRGLCLERMVGLTVWRMFACDANGHEMLETNRKAGQRLQNSAAIPILSLGFVWKEVN